MQPLFVSQTQLYAWIEESHATFEDNVLTLPSRGLKAALVPGVRIDQLVDGDDSRGWLTRVFTNEQLESAGAERYHTSIIVGETAYECEEGFVGPPVDAAPAAAGPTAPVVPAGVEVVPPTAAAAVPPSAPAASSIAAAVEGADAAQQESDMDMLADFLLKNLDGG